MRHMSLLEIMNFNAAWCQMSIFAEYFTLAQADIFKFSYDDVYFQYLIQFANPNHQIGFLIYSLTLRSSIKKRAN